MVNKIKRECFKYFTGRDDEPIKESIKGVTKKFKMPKEMAKSYYFEWREMSSKKIMVRSGGSL